MKTRRFELDRAAIALAAALLIAGPAWAQSSEPADPPAEPESATAEARRKAGEIVTQPVRDVGLMKREIPPVLLDAHDDPYNLDGLKTCKQLSTAVTQLNEVLGPDFAVSHAKKESRARKIAEAGAAAAVNSLIPWRGLVREVSGAGPAERRLNAAIDAGYARRGFLRGVHYRQRCATPF